MECIYCGSKTSVSNCRPLKTIPGVWRRRACNQCGALFTTTETPDLTKSVIVTAGSHKAQAFDRDRLFLSVYAACEHRPSALSDATALTDTVTKKFLKHQQGAISKSTLCEIVFETLEAFDAFAASYFLAHHKNHLEGSQKPKRRR